MVRTTKHAAALYIASIVGVHLHSGPAHAQEKPESSLSALFPVGDTTVIWQVGTDSVPAATKGRVAGLTMAGAVVGDFAALYMAVASFADGLFGDGDYVALLWLAPAVAVGGPVADTAIAGGNVGSSLKGSLIGLAGGLLLGAGVLNATDSDGAGLVALLATHAVTASLFAIRPQG